MDARQRHDLDPEPGLYDELVDAILEQDAAHCRRVCEQLQQLRQREAPDAEAVRVAPQAPRHPG